MVNLGEVRWAAMVAVLLVVVTRCSATPAAQYQYAFPAIPQGDDILFVDTFDDEQCLQRWIPSSKTAFKGARTSCRRVGLHSHSSECISLLTQANGALVKAMMILCLKMIDRSLLIPRLKNTPFLPVSPSPLLFVINH